MPDKPSFALRLRSRSVAGRRSQPTARVTVVSAGNTGALLAIIFAMLMSMAPRPSLARYAYGGGEPVMLDLVANLECDARTRRFGVMARLRPCAARFATINVGLLNVARGT